MANKVTISNTDNKVTVTPQSNNSVSASTTNTPVTVIQGTAKVITVNTPGPKGEKGDVGFVSGNDIEIRNLTASGNISASGRIDGERIGSFRDTITFGRTHFELYRPFGSTLEMGRVGTLGTGVNSTYNEDKGYRLYLTNMAGGAAANTQHLAVMQNGDVEIDSKSAEQNMNLSGSAKLFVGGNISTNSNITASGDISASGDITGVRVEVDGRMQGALLRVTGNQEHYMDGGLSFKNGPTDYRAATIARGGRSLGTVGGDVETNDIVISTNNLNNFFIFKGNSGTGGGALIISGARSPESGSPSLDVRGPISASGNISSSGDIIATNVSASILRISNPEHAGQLTFFQDSDNSYRLASNIGTIFDFGSTNVITTSQRIDGTRGMTIQTFKASDLIKFRDFDSNDIIVVDNSGSLTLGNASGHEPHVTINTDLTASGNISASGDITAGGANIIGTTKITGDVSMGPQGSTGPIAGYTLSIRDTSPNIALKNQTSDFGIGGIEFDATTTVSNLILNPTTGSTNANTPPTVTIKLEDQEAAKFTTSSLILDYDKMPTADPGVKGTIYRSSSLGLNNLLFISAG